MARIRIVSLLAFLFTVATAGGAAAAPDATCLDAVNNASIDWAGKFAPGQPPSSDPTKRQRAVSLQALIELKVSKLVELYKACKTSRIVLFLNGYPIKGLTPLPPSNPGEGRLFFKLAVSENSRAASDSADDAKRANEARQSWVPVLGSPRLSPRTVEVSVGPEDGYAVKSSDTKNTTLDLQIIAPLWLAIWGIIFVVLLGIFLFFALFTNILRDGNPAPAEPSADSSAVPRAEYGPYSLSKTQGAWWFFIILAAYLFIGIVTSDFTTSLNSTALILLGIGAGTVVASALIDKAKETQDASKVQTAVTEARAKLVKLKADIDGKNDELKNAPADKVEQVTKELNALKDQKEEAESDYRKLTRQNEQFLRDILSDADGISFHRFQMAAWTLVLGIIFISSTYYNLAMPIFDTTLMGLLGLSAGTYLGLKIPEAPTPKK
jgi:hypothetical protein